MRRRVNSNGFVKSIMRPNDSTYKDTKYVSKLEIHKIKRRIYMQKDTKSKDEATCRKTQDQKTKLHVERHKIKRRSYIQKDTKSMDISQKDLRGAESALFSWIRVRMRGIVTTQFSMWILKNIILPLGIKSKHFVQIITNLCSKCIHQKVCSNVFKNISIAKAT